MTDATETPSDDAVLSDEDAVALLNDEPQEEAAEAPADDAEPAEDAEEAEEAEEEAEEAAPPVEAPHFWSAEDKAAFAKAPPEVQAAIVEHENNRNRAAEQFIQRTAESAKQYQTAAEKLTELFETARQNEDLFGPVDWEEWLRTDPGGALAAQHKVQQLQAAKAEADRNAFASFLQEEGRKLPTVAPELADPVDGPKRRAELGQYLVSQGVPPEQLTAASAIELAIAYKAMKFDQAQAAAKTATTRKPAEAPRKPVKPTSAQPGSSPQRTAQQLSNRFAQTRSDDDAVALILAGNL